jgi:hypothetical protein
MSRPSKTDIHLSLFDLGGTTFPNLPGIMPKEYAGVEPQHEKQVYRNDNGKQHSISHDVRRIQQRTIPLDAVFGY